MSDLIDAVGSAEEEVATTEVTTEVTTEEGAETTEQADTEAKLWAGKYKTEDELEKGYKNLESRFGAFKGSPEEYELGEDIDADDEMVKYTQAWAKDNQMSNEALNDLIGGFSDYREGIEKRNLEAEIKQLGDNANQRINDLVKWGKGAFEDKEDQAAFQSLATSAKGVEVIEKLIGMTKDKPLINERQTDPASSGMNQEKLDEMIHAVDKNGNRKMGIDAEYTKKVYKLIEEYNS